MTYNPLCQVPLEYGITSEGNSLGMPKDKYAVTYYNENCGYVSVFEGDGELFFDGAVDIEKPLSEIRLGERDPEVIDSGVEDLIMKAYRASEIGHLESSMDVITDNRVKTK